MRGGADAAAAQLEATSSAVARRDALADTEHGYLSLVRSQSAPAGGGGGAAPPVQDLHRLREQLLALLPDHDAVKRLNELHVEIAGQRLALATQLLPDTSLLQDADRMGGGASVSEIRPMRNVNLDTAGMISYCKSLTLPLVCSGCGETFTDPSAFQDHKGEWDSDKKIFGVNCLPKINDIITSPNYTAYWSLGEVLPGDPPVTYDRTPSIHMFPNTPQGEGKGTIKWCYICDYPGHLARDCPTMWADTYHWDGTCPHTMCTQVRDAGHRYAISNIVDTQPIVHDDDAGREREGRRKRVQDHRTSRPYYRGSIRPTYDIVELSSGACEICEQPMDMRATGILTMSCGHSFHVDCLQNSV